MTPHAALDYDFLHSVLSWRGTVRDRASVFLRAVQASRDVH